VARAVTKGSLPAAAKSDMQPYLDANRSMSSLRPVIEPEKQDDDEQPTWAGMRGDRRMDEPAIIENAHARDTTPYPESQAGPPRRTGRFVFQSGDRPLAGYTIKRGVGAGGFGEIYFATSDAGKEVALKLLRQHLDVELRGIRQCLNLKNPNLLSIHDIRQDDQGNTWVVMEYVAGPCLEQAIAQYPRGMPVETALTWLRGIGTAVGYLHDRGIVHRDLKPANIFSEEGLVKVGDYGLSKFISCSRRSGHTESIGTVHYMAPEVANGRYGKELDIYALGIILYEMVTGRVPFEGESVGEVLMKHLTAQPDLTPVPIALRRVVGKALEKDPANRYQSVAQMLADLPGATASPFVAGAAVLHEMPLRPQAASPDEPVWRFVRQMYDEASSAWSNAKLSTPTTIVLIVAGLFFLFTTAGYWIPLGFVLLACYGLYRVVRAVAMAVSVVPIGAAHCPRTQSLPAMVVKPLKVRITELLGSMLASSAVTAVVCVVVGIVRYYNQAPTRVDQLAWLFGVSMVGVWTVLALGKLWEGVQGEPILRRFVLMAAGMGVGLVGAAAMMAVNVPSPDNLQLLTADPDFPRPMHYVLPPNFYAGDGTPQILAFVASFGTLFALVGWWKQTNPLRRTRLSLISVAWSAVAGGMVAAIWHFPQPWLVIVAGTIAVAVQLSSPLDPVVRRS